MKQYILTFLIIIYSYSSFAQKLSTVKSFEKTLEIATKNNKPVLIIVNVPERTPPPNFNGVKIDYSSAVDDVDVIKKMNENFVIYKSLMTDSSLRSILSKSNINSFPAYIFLHPNTDLFYKDFGNFRDKQIYLSMIDKALVASKNKSISELEKDYLANKTDITLLKKLIDERKKVGVNNNAELIEQYVNNLKIGEFSNYQTVLYILEAGPYADGSAFKLAHTNQKIIDSIYRTEPLQKRMSFNNFIINNTMNEAIKRKNVNKAQSAANFTSSTWSNDYLRGQKAYSSEMLRYYSAVQDTTNYFRNAVYYYDTYFMNLSADSIKKAEARNRDDQMKRNMPTIEAKGNFLPKEKMDSLLKVRGNQNNTKSFTMVGSASSSYAMELNNAAWKFYELGTKNINYLTKAMIWSRRSIELNPIGGYYDTLAHLLYRLGYFEEAMKTQEDAIKKNRAEGRDSNLLENELKKMKSKTI